MPFQLKPHKTTEIISGEEIGKGVKSQSEWKAVSKSTVTRNA